VLKKDIKTTARLLRLIEKQDISAIAELKDLYPLTGNAHIIGITGLPGSGKSTIIATIIESLRKDGKTVGVIAIDPSSPYTGGSLLGDRIRMQKYSTDDGVFIKSIPTAGWHGGISRVTSKMITVMDAAGYDSVLVETVGVGQAEVDIASLVHTTVVVLVGGLGDYIQVIKAGILEIADIYVINKTDINDGTDLEYNLKNLKNISTEDKKIMWDPPVILTQATGSIGISSLTQAITSHKEYLKNTSRFMDFFESRYRTELKQILLGHVTELLEKKLEDDPDFKKLLNNKNSKDPYSAAEKIFTRLFYKNKPTKGVNDNG
jgi:LAO/AO transport system kinase